MSHQSNPIRAAAVSPWAAAHTTPPPASGSSFSARLVDWAVRVQRSRPFELWLVAALTATLTLMATLLGQRALLDNAEFTPLVTLPPATAMQAASSPPAALPLEQEQARAASTPIPVVSLRDLPTEGRREAASASASGSAKPMSASKPASASKPTSAAAGPRRRSPSPREPLKATAFTR